VVDSLSIYRSRQSDRIWDIRRNIRSLDDSLMTEGRVGALFDLLDHEEQHATNLRPWLRNENNNNADPDSVICVMLGE
jgi:hypothetical protein